MSNQVYKDSVNKYVDPEISDLNSQIDVILSTFELSSFTTTFEPDGSTISVSAPIDILLSKYNSDAIN